MTPEQFFAAALPWANKAAAHTGVLVSVVLAQWADETGYGGPDWFPNNNPGNVGSFDGQPVATFPSLQAGVAAYIQTMNQDIYNGVREAAPWGPLAQARALGQSPWASGHYGSPAGQDLISIIDKYDLTIYDAPPPAGQGGTETMTSWQEGGQNHVVGLVGSKVYHWWQQIGGNPPGQPSWNVEILPTP